jgi:hypothetical protein
MAGEPVRKEREGFHEAGRDACANKKGVPKDA